MFSPKNIGKPSNSPECFFYVRNLTSIPFKGGAMYHSYKRRHIRLLQKENKKRQPPDSRDLGRLSKHVLKNWGRPTQQFGLNKKKRVILTRRSASDGSPKKQDLPRSDETRFFLKNIGEK